MPGLTLIGDDIRQLTQLAASLRGRFRSISIVHTPDPIARASAAGDDPDGATLVCLDGRAGVAVLAAQLPRVVFVVEDAGLRDQLTALGATCVRADDSPARIASLMRTRGREQSRPRRLHPRHIWPSPARWPLPANSLSRSI
jgi:hypothetical protein